MAEPTVQDRLANVEKALTEINDTLSLINLTLHGDTRLHLDGLAKRVSDAQKKTEEIEGRTRASLTEIEKDLFKTRSFVVFFAVCGAIALVATIAVIIEANGGIIP